MWASPSAVASDKCEALPLFLRCFQQRTQSLDGDSERPASESVHVSGVDADNFAFGVEDRASAATVGCGRIVNELIAHHIAEVAEGGGGTNQRQCRQFAGRGDVIMAIGKPLINACGRL